MTKAGTQYHYSKVSDDLKCPKPRGIARDALQSARSMYEKPLLKTTLKDLKKEVKKIKRSQSREVQRFVKNIEVTPDLEADIKTLRESIQSQKQKVKVQRMGERKKKMVL